MNRWPLLLLTVSLALIGCAKAPPADPEASPPTEHVKVENLVRQVIADQFGVKPTDVAMDRPLSDPPLRADDLDLVELVMELEDRLQITIPDEALEKRSDPTHKPNPTQVTPADLVAIARHAKPAPAGKPK